MLPFDRIPPAPAGLVALCAVDGEERFSLRQGHAAVRVGNGCDSCGAHRGDGRDRGASRAVTDDRGQGVDVGDQLTYLHRVEEGVVALRLVLRRVQRHSPCSQVKVGGGRSGVDQRRRTNLVVA